MVSNIYGNSFLPNVKTYHLNPGQANKKGSSVDPDASGKRKQQLNDEYSHDNSNSLNKLLTSDNSNINVSDILKDFKSTMTAIGVPKSSGKYIMEHLKTAHIEASKNNPSISQIQSNLCEAAKKLDSFISETLGQPSTVVKQWMDALLLQKVDYKATDPLPEQMISQAPKQIETRDQNQSPQNKGFQQILEAEIVSNNTLPVSNLEEMKVQNSIELNDASNFKPEKALMPLEIPKVPEEKITPEIKTPDMPQSRPKNINHEARMLYQQAKQDLSSGNINIAEQKLYAVLDAARESHDEKLMLVAHNKLGDIEDTKYNLSGALEHYNEALKLASKLDNKKALGKLHYNIGSIYEDLNRSPQALKHFYASLEFDGETENLSGQALTLTTIGNIYSAGKDYNKALEHYAMADGLAAQSGEYEARAHILSNTGTAQKKLHNLSGAMKSYRESLELDRKANNLEGYTNTLFNIGEIYEMSGNQNAAKKAYQIVLNNATSLNDTYLADLAFQKLNSNPGDKIPA